MNEHEWQRLGTEELERLVIERWLYRGIMMGVMAMSAILTTYFGAQGLRTMADRLTVAALVIIALVAAIIAFSMRQHDIKIHRELHRRRQTGSGPG